MDSAREINEEIQLELTKNPVKFITEFFANYLLFCITNTKVIVHMINL